MNAYYREWYRANPSRARAIKDRWVERHPERRTQVSREYHERHREQNARRLQEWRKQNPEKVRAQRQRQFERDPEKRRARNRNHMRTNARRYQYGVTDADMAALVAVQDSCCALCGEQTDSLAVDHDHRTGAVRGIICRACNWGLGQFRDSPDILTAAIEYLKHPPMGTNGPTIPR